MNGFGFGFFDSLLKISVFVINIVFFFVSLTAKSKSFLSLPAPATVRKRIKKSERDE